MTRLALRSLTSRPLRTVLTLLAILLGVAMITGTYVLTDQIDNGFADIFKTSFRGTAVQVAPKTIFASTDGSGTTPQILNNTMLAQIQGVPGVARAAGTYQTLGAAIVDGKTIQTGGAPTLLTTNPGPPFNQARLIAGHGAQAANEVNIIKSFADKEGLKPGDSFDVAAPAGLQHVKVTGVFTWGDAGSMGGTIVIAGRLQDVQRWGGEPGKLSGVSVAADPGVTPAQLAARVKAALPATVSVKTGEQAAAGATADSAAAINSFLTPMLLAFAGVSVFVGAFIIFNAFSITVAQRRREFAMLRALGASRRQVLRSVVAEALTLGVFASAIGIVAGLGVAKAINLLFKAVGADIPTAGIALEPRTILIAALVGVGVTLISALAPALRATRVPPVAALQEGAALPPTRFAKFTTAIALAIAALGGGALAYGMLAGGAAGGRLLFMGLGALLLFVAIAMLAKYIVRPASRIIGWPLEKLAPTSGRLARDNVGRNPSRTAATAAALMIGLALVVFIAVFAHTLMGSLTGAMDKSTRAELVAQDRSAFLTVPQKSVRSVDAVQGVDTATGVGYADLKVKKGGVTTTYAIDPAAFSRVWAFQWSHGGSDALLAKLNAHNVLLEDGSPIAGKVKTGDTISVMTQGGKKTRLTVLGFYKDQMAFTGMITSLGAFKALDVPTAAVMIMVRTQDGANVGATQDAVQKALSAFPTQKVLTKSEYLDTINKQISQILMMFYGLLAMSVLISIFGIINTLVLSVHERTREIGMLRAIGATRRQLRQMVRYESVITAVIGGVLGTAVGIAMAYVMVTQMGGDGLVFSLPWLQLGVCLVLAVVVGVVAAVLPARRAANTRILEAIQYE
jgi:putative ABC transport system permease protein